MMNEDNDKTVVRSRRVPMSATADSVPEHGANVLPAGTRLGEFEILDLIGEGGFGIVYLAYDHSLERHVALKEYMPSGLATRTRQLLVTVRSQQHADTFTAGLKSFVNEARLLAQFDSPSLVKVHRFWEENGTAYMVMPFYDGITLKQAMKERRIKPTEEWIRMILADLLDAIETIHRVQCFHRDIAPDNILLLKDGRPVLLDFGAARRVIGDLTQGPTVILKPGFAPIEQYADIAGLRQGAWTDIYALAAVVYYLVTGKAPPPAVARIVHDDMAPLREAGRGRYSMDFLAAMDKALSLKPEQRFQSIAELRNALDIMDTSPRNFPRTASGMKMTSAGSTPGPAPAHETAQRAAANNPAQQAAPKMQSVAQPDSEWQKTRGMNRQATGDRPRRRKRASWPMLILLLAVGVGTGVYWSAHRLMDEAGDQTADQTIAGQPALQSSGSSETVEETPAASPASPAPSTPSSAAPPATATPPPSASSPADIAPAPPRVMQGSGEQHSQPQQAATGSAPRATPAARSPAEEELWRVATATDNNDTYQIYLHRYPKGRYAAVAKQKLKRTQLKPENRQEATLAMQSRPAVTEQPRPESAPSSAPAAPAPSSDTSAQTAPAAPPSPEDELWKAIIASDKSADYQTYLDKYPDGRHATAARDKLASLKREEPAAPVVQPETKERTAPAEEAQTPAPQYEPEPKSLAKQGPPSGPASGNTVIRVGDQTMTGRFSTDPKTGAVSGTGHIAWSNGDRFDGTLVRGIKQGKGQFIWANGQRYKGDWANDMPNGRGTIWFANGNRYTGEVKDGMPHGEGTTHFKDGDVYSGSWVQGKSQGQGRYTWANDSYWEGEFRDGKQTENGKMVFAENKAASDSSGASAAASSAGEPGEK